MNGTSKLAQVVFSILSALFTTFTTALNFIIPCFLVIMLDVFTAWMLQRRVHKRHPEHSDGKFKSEYKFRIIITLILVFVLLILGAYVDMLIIKTGDYAVRFAAGMFLFYEFWSCLENWSSENENKFARVLQRIMVDKAERHFNVDMHELKPDDNQTDASGEPKNNQKNNLSYGKMRNSFAVHP